MRILHICLDLFEKKKTLFRTGKKMKMCFSRFKEDIGDWSLSRVQLKGAMGLSTPLKRLPLPRLLEHGRVPQPVRPFGRVLSGS